ncbi:MAG TPA: BBP7 family outer membrane beta-barrel protein [Planctomycetaceae bacterium]|nr:BBP7 family outer membrane beta-barrel protein [Planctomycetaceae bacterium]
MFVRSFNLRLFSFAATVLFFEAPLFAQGVDAPPQYAPPQYAPPSADTRPTAPPPAPGSGTTSGQYFQAPSLAPPPLESEPPFNAPPPLQPGPMLDPSGPPQPGPPFGPPPLYPTPRAYVPPVYVPPSGPLLIPFESPSESRIWIRSEYLAWWTKDAPLPAPLVTVGSAGDSIPGALGQPGTQVLYGGGNADMGVANGWRLDMGVWLDHEQRFGLQGGFFILERQSSGFGAFSDENGYPVLARPVINANGGGETAYVDSLPGSLAGGVIVTNTSQFLGYDLNGLFKIFQTEHFRLDGILGFRYLNLTESLELDDQLSPLTSGALTFLGQPVDTSSTMVDFDRFETTNNFYGGQLGTRMEWTWGRWSLDMTTKLALGTTQEKANINGGTTVFPASGPGTSAPGGILTSTANIGEYYQSPFAFVPELDLNVAYAITPHLSVRLGYSFIYWSNVLRPGDQVNRLVSPNLIPSDPTYGQAGSNQPQYQFNTTNYWAQGLNLGLDFHF